MIFIAGTIFLCGYSRLIINKKIPDRIILTKNTEEIIPMTFGEDVVVNGNNVGSYVMDVKLFGVLYLKSIDVKVVDELYVYPGGMAIGMYLQTDGVLVIGSGAVTDHEGVKREPAMSLVRPGDYIIAINGIDISSKSQLIFLINKYGSDRIVLTIRRGLELIDISITPVKVSKDQYMLGIWVRDDAQGIGTITYVTEKGYFGALGHGVSDTDTGQLLDSRGGRLYKANIWGIEKGKAGEPGGLCGYITYEKEYIMGDIYNNNNRGIYGKLTVKCNEIISQKKIEVAYKQNVHTGKAYIRSQVSGELKDYEINIEKVNLNNDGNYKDLVINVTDQELINITGGIVQGMSGSPIIQDGKLIGAVTHVLVKNPVKGYGIFIEHMLEQ